MINCQLKFLPNTSPKSDQEQGWKSSKHTLTGA